MLDSIPLSSLAVGVAIGLSISAAMWMALQGRRVRELRSTLAQREASLAHAQQDLSSARLECGRLEAELEAARLISAEKIVLVQSAESRLREAFSALSSEALKHNSEAFLQLARASLGEFQRTASVDLDGRQKAIETIVAPLKESLTKVDAKLQEVERGRASGDAQLSEQLRSLAQAQHVLFTETSRLSRAMRSPNIRGQWGELQLRRVLENAGMIAGSHYEVKESVVGEEGRLTPDVVVKLPGGKNVVVDSKVPLTAYLDAAECEDDGARDAKMREHARQVREHVARLASKAYWTHFQPAPDIVVMFVPGEALLNAALQHDPALLEFSMGRGVMLASPLTLIALLRAVAYGWQQETVAKNAQEISELGRSLYERIAKLAEHFENVGKSLARSVEAYNSAVGTLESRVLVTARRLRDKGVTAPEEFPEVQTIDHTPRPLGAPELVGLFEDQAVEAPAAKPRR